MRVIVYVEGASDKDAMRACLRPLIEDKATEGIAITFAESPRGNKKNTLLQMVPLTAVNILLNEPEAVVVAVPDLYPPNRVFEHDTPDALRAGMLRQFEQCLREKGVDDQRLRQRFKVFCFKHDLEVLLLAAEEELMAHLHAKRFNVEWRKPVEDQNHGHPPARVVADLFHAHHRSYQKRTDAPLILSNSRYQVLADRCPQCFKPFVEFLAGLTPRGVGAESG